MNSLKIKVEHVKQTMKLGGLIAKYLIAENVTDQVILLKGDLGSGKTVLAKGFLKEFEFETSEVTSPTFILIKRFEVLKSKINIYHIDLYRLNHPGELEGIGLYDILDEKNSICLVEWAEKLDYYPDNSMELELTWLDDNVREISIKGDEDLIDLIKRSGFVE